MARRNLCGKCDVVRALVSPTERECSAAKQTANTHTRKQKTRPRTGILILAFWESPFGALLAVTQGSVFRGGPVSLPRPATGCYWVALDGHIAMLVVLLTCMQMQKQRQRCNGAEAPRKRNTPARRAVPCAANTSWAPDGAPPSLVCRTRRRGLCGLMLVLVLPTNSSTSTWTGTWTGTSTCTSCCSNLHLPNRPSGNRLGAKSRRHPSVRRPYEDGSGLKAITRAWANRQKNLRQIIMGPSAPSLALGKGRVALSLLRLCSSGSSSSVPRPARAHSLLSAGPCPGT